MFKIGDLQFDTASAEIWKDPSDQPTCWRLSIQAIAREIDGELWTPKFYWEDMCIPLVTEWDDLRHVKVEWDDVQVHSFESPPTLFVFEHLLIRRAAFELNYLSDTQFSFNLHGNCDVYFSDTYGESLPFSVDVVLEKSEPR